MRKIKLSNWMKRLLAIAAFLALFSSIFIYFFPLQIAEWSNRWEFWQEGVTEFTSNGVHGYVKDRCQGALQSSKECTCVAMVHGLADNAMTWKKILLWPTPGWLKPVKLFAFDLPGSGGTPAPLNPLDGYRVRNQARVLVQAMSPLCSKWIVAGNSLGGWVAAWAALDWPEGVSKLVLLDSSGLKSAVDPHELQAFINPTVEAMKDFQQRAYYKGRPLPDNVWRAAARRMKESNARQVLEAQTSEDYLDGRITTLRRPALILWGEADRLTPISVGQQLKALMPGAVWVPVPQCGHLPQKECPLDVIKVIARMVDFGAV